MGEQSDGTQRGQAGSVQDPPPALDALFSVARDGGSRSAELEREDSDGQPPGTLDALFRMARDGQSGGHESDREDPGDQPRIIERSPQQPQQQQQPPQQQPQPQPQQPPQQQPQQPPPQQPPPSAVVATSQRRRRLTVIATSALLWPVRIARSARRWLQRRSRQLGAFLRRRWLIALAALALAGTASGLAIALPRNAGTTVPSVGRSANAGAPAHGDTGVLHTATAARDAATWVAQQVSRDAVVACDPAMCRALHASGFPVANLLILRSAAADPLASDVIVATAVVRDRLGSRLWLVDARIAIARFGSGPARIDILAVAPDGASAYQAALSADQAARRKAGAELLQNPRIQATGAAARELGAGQVDSRLLITFAALTTSHVLNIVALSGSAPGADPGVPVRVMGVTAPGSAAQSAAELRTIRSFMLAQRAPYLPKRVGLARLTDGRAVVRVEFGAPSPLGLLGTPAA